MNVKKNIPAAVILLLIGTMIYAQSLNDCFNGYKENDLELQQLQVKVLQAENSLERAKIENDAEINLSTGDMSVELNSEETTVEFSPEATVSLPAFNGTSVTASVPMVFEFGNADSDARFDNADVTISTDIISNTSSLAALEVEDAERNLILAMRDADVRRIAVEESFWNEVRGIYEAAQSLAAAKTILYTAQSDFNEVLVEGYAQFSSTYISAQLKVNSAERDVKEGERLLANALSNFSVECGMHSGALKEIPELPASLASMELADIKKFDKQMYIGIEEAVWTNSYNEKSRQADTDFNLNAYVGYGWDNYNSTSDEITASLSTGLSAAYKGISVSAGVSTPLDYTSNPSFLLSVGWDLTGSRTSVLDDNDDEYERRLELLDIKTAEKSYIDDIQAAETEYGDLIWSRQENSDNLAMYKKLYEDSVVWSEQGLIADSDLAQNKNSYEQAKYTASLTDIDYVLYNLQIAQYFIASEVTDYTQADTSAIKTGQEKDNDR